MEMCLVGKTIKEFRNRLHISQEELCIDICAVSSLSRIESGQQVPGRKLAEALFSRMGMAAPASDVPMTQAEFKRGCLEHQLTDMAARGNYDFSVQLEDYEKCASSMDIFEKQFLVFFKAIYNYRHGQSPQEVLDQYAGALKLTLSSFCLEGPLKPRLLTRTELMLINNCALVMYELGRKKSAIVLMQYLKDHFEKSFIDPDEKAKNYPVILFNLANWKGQEGFYQEALDISCRGIEVCAEYGKLFYFAEHIFNKGYSLAKLGKNDQAAESFKSAFIIMKESGRAEMVDRLKNEILKEFKDLPVIM